MTELHPTLNENISTDLIKVDSTQKVWWAGGCGHVWEASVFKRTKRAEGCPACKNDDDIAVALKEVCPEFADEYHSTLNVKLYPRNLYGDSSKALWWLCPEGHEWKASIPRRTSKKANCPDCTLIRKEAKARAQKLATTHPSLALYWHPTLNEGRRSDEVKFSLEGTYWWRLPCGETKRMGMKSFSKKLPNPSCCSICRRRAFIGKYWHATKNGELTLEESFFDLTTKVWCQCSKGHEWLEDPSEQLTERQFNVGCVPCNNENRLLSEWHPTLNGSLIPEEVLKNHQSAYIWWQCSEGHEFMSEPKNLVLRKSGMIVNCRVCVSLKKIQLGAERFSSLHPEIAAYWHPTLNGELCPDQLTIGSNYLYWWVNEQCGHAWSAYLSNMITNPVCRVCISGKALRLGTNDLATTHPAIAERWHPTKNGELLPSQIQIGESADCWWLDEKCGHEWQTNSINRNFGYPCPVC